MATLEELEKRIQCLEDLEDIKRLKAKYARACDENDAELWKEVFTDDAMWDGGDKYGVHKISDMIAAVAAGQPPSEPVLHYFTNPEITIEGDKAYGRWLLWRASTTVSWVLGPTYEANSRAVWVVSYEDDKYVRINGKWRQSEMKLTLLFQIQTPYEEG